VFSRKYLIEIENKEKFSPFYFDTYF